MAENKGLLVEKCMPTLERFEEVEKQVFFPIPVPEEFSATIRIYASTMSRKAVRKTLAKIREAGWKSPEEYHEIIMELKTIQAEVNKSLVKAERERIREVVESHNSIDYLYGADFKQAILKAFGKEEGKCKSTD